MKLSLLRSAGSACFIFFIVLSISFYSAGVEASPKEVEWEAVNAEAKTALDRGDVTEAKRLLEKAARLAEESFGPSHMKTAVALRKLAELQSVTGESDAAAKTLDRAALTWKSHLGEGHPYAADLLIQSARNRETAKDWTGAQAAFKSALQIQKKYYGERHTAVASTLQELARAEREAGLNAAARRSENVAAEILLEALEPAHPRTLGAFEALAAHAVEEGDLTYARNNLKRVLASAGTAPHPPLHQLASVWILSGDLASQDKDVIAAEESYSKALELFDRLGDEARPQILTTLYKLRELYQSSGRDDAATDITERAKRLEADTGSVASESK